MLSFGSCRVMSPSNKALYITSVGWVYILNLGAVLVLSEFISIDWLSFQSLWSLSWSSCVIEMSQFVDRVYAAFIQSPYAIMLLFEGSWNLCRPFLRYLDFACWPFLIQLLVRALYDRVLPHYTNLLSTSCWMMGDALMPSFQRISSHRLQIIYSGIGI